MLSMASGLGLTKADRFRRLSEIRNLLEDGKTPHEISKELGLPILTVQRNIKYLDELAIAEISPEELANKRSELYLELIEAASEAKSLFDRHKIDGNSLEIKRYFDMWLETIKTRASIYGLDSFKADNIINFNTLVNNPQTIIDDKIDANIANSLTKALKESHERKIREQYEAELESEMDDE